MSQNASANTRPAGRLDIGRRLILGFAVIILAMLAADGIVLWQFHVVSTHVGRLNDIDQKLIAVLRVHTGLLVFHDQLDALADSEDADLLVAGAGPLRAAVLDDIHRAASVLSLLPRELRRDPTILITLQTLESALPSQIESITTLAQSGDWRAVRLRLANQIRPLESVASALVERVEGEVDEARAQIVSEMEQVQRRVFLIVPATAVLSLLIAGALGLALTRSITQPLERLVTGSKALARGEFDHRVVISGDDELARLGQVFNDTALRLRDLYVTLQRSEDRLRLVIDTIPAHVWSALPDGSVDFINARWQESTGLPVSAGLGWDWSSIVHPEDLARYAEEWNRAFATGQPIETEARLRRADGQYRWWLIRNVPLRDEQNVIVKWYGTAVDIEERHIVEEALRRSEAYLNEAQRVSRTGSWRHDLASNVLTVSPEARRIWGIGPNDDASRDFFFARIHREDSPLVLANYATARRERAEFLSDFRIVLPDGAMRNVHVVGHPILNQSGDIIEFVGAALDVTERKHAEEALRQAQADLAHVSRVTTMGELTASLAHEVKQPIAAAVMNANSCVRWLAHDPPDIGEARAAALRIAEDGRRATDIIGRIRLLFMKGAPQHEWVDANDLIREMVILLRSEATRYDIVLRTALDSDVPLVMGDRVQLQQVLMNLIMNAIDAMKSIKGARELVITSQTDEHDQLLVSVSDTGVGLPSDRVEEIFRAFFSTKEHGIGMGLSISRSIVESHGGRLWATEHAPRGARFSLTLPTRSVARA